MLVISRREMGKYRMLKLSMFILTFTFVTLKTDELVQVRRRVHLQSSS
jgi:hypothetical protein